MGVTEQLIFPEIDFDSVDHQRGMDITFVTTANTDEEAKALLDAFGFPFKKYVHLPYKRRSHKGAALGANNTLCEEDISG